MFKSKTFEKMYNNAKKKTEEEHLGKTGATSVNASVSGNLAADAFLKKIASTDEFASITDLSDLGGSFSKIAQAIGDGSTGLSVL